MRFQKGNTKVALYFVGHISESILSTMMNDDVIKFEYPGEDYQRVLVFNQRRNNAKEYGGTVPTLDIHLNQIPDIFDCIIWGDESFSKAELESSPDGCKICRVGASSLSGLRKADFCQKFMGILSFEGTRIKMESRQL